MSYANQQDLIDWCGIGGADEIKQLTDPTNSTIDTLLVAKKLAQADAEINGRLVGVTLPMSAPYPKLLIDIACRISRFLLYTAGRPEYVEADYQYALRLLDDIRNGKATLGLSGDETGPADVAAAMRPSVASNTVVFTDAVLGTL